MRNIKRRLAWCALALILQQCIFLYFDKVYLASDLNIKAEEVKDEDNVADKKTEINIKKGVSEIKVSSDARYVSYIEDSKLKTLDSNDDKEKVCDTDSGSEIVFYRWLNSEDNMIIIQKIKEKGAYYFEPISFDAKKGEARDLADFDLKKVRIKLESTKDEINNVVFSTLTHSLYIEVKKSSGKCDLYYANVMNQLKKVKSEKVIGNVVVPTTSTNAIMEENNSITILNTKGNVSIPNVKSAKILGADVNDNVYFGEVADNKIKNIYYSVLSDSQRKWNQLKLAKPVDKNDILIDYSGKVYINSKSDNSVLELTSNKNIKYKGELVQSYSKGIISRDGNTLIKNKLE
ncbi:MULTISPECIES: hypothetical protein [Clostridium]|jgi:hypothetical protein|uniref:Adhesin domain-containing protein n=3 Tax=Clostridium TaxID=1485 RepID=A0AB74VJU9_CLOBE|nr:MULTISPECIES: hypothetical protein [Clostridium]AVK50428.1 hypothetical protein AXY43_21805 [Clostridium sp. MF28]MBC2459016.1 hypothetical protein [Clostridium beijerinckii]MBC2475300.1 hypothetical protein [Clostridium beijerinckii]NOV58917.1 dipeptidyl aminopeptidase/acylaminoacyl peptidase [Clostridium beijerinckii]NOV71695.1 dipeptidyl aminopeptidase/acylaminoacyl peptidase [Clostridium beijerinckii]